MSLNFAEPLPDKIGSGLPHFWRTAPMPKRKAKPAAAAKPIAPLFENFDHIEETIVDAVEACSPANRFLLLQSLHSLIKRLAKENHVNLQPVNLGRPVPQEWLTIAREQSDD
jgi:hypothetical protein